MHLHFHVSCDGDLFTLRFQAPKQLLLHPEFEQMVWDETLRRAHEAGHIPVGPIHICTEDDEGLTGALVEGQPMAVADAVAIPSDMMLVSAQVQIALSL